MKSVIAFVIAVFLLLGCTGGAAQPKVTEGNQITNNANGPMQNTSVIADGSVQNQTQTANSSATQTTNSSSVQPQDSSSVNPIVPPPTQNTTGVMMADYIPPELPHFDFSTKTTPDGNLIIYYFYLPRCSACLTIRPDIERLKAKYPQVVWEEYDISNQTGRWAYEAYSAQMNLTKDQMYVPQTLVDGVIITTWVDINATLEGNITSFYSSSGRAAGAGK